MTRAALTALVQGACVAANCGINSPANHIFYLDLKIGDNLAVLASR